MATQTMSNDQLEDLFLVSYGNKFDLNKMTAIDGGINFVGRSSQNLGVTATIPKVEGVQPYPAGLVTVALGGTKLLCAFVQPEPFYTAQNVAVLKPKIPMKLEEKIYVCLAIRHNRFRYSAFGREANRTIKTLEIPSFTSLPSWLEDASEAAHSHFLRSLGPLKNYAVAPQTARASLGGERVPVEALFEVVYGSNLELNKMHQDASGINFVSRTSKNNGVAARVKAVDGLTPIEGGVLTVAGGGSVLETFLQLDPFYSGRDLYYLKPRIGLSVDELLFFCTCIRANMFRYSYGRQANRTLKALLIPALESIPKWVYGGSAAVIEEIEKEIATAEAR